MKYLLGIIGIVGAFFMIKYREWLADVIGEAEWMKRIGGVYVVIVLAAVIIFFWSLAEMTDSTYLLFSPLKYLFPGMNGEAWGEEGW